MDTNKTVQNFYLEEISFAELNSIKGGNAVAFAGTIIGGLKFALELSYYIGFGVGYYLANQ